MDLVQTESKSRQPKGAAAPETAAEMSAGFSAVRNDQRPARANGGRVQHGHRRREIVEQLLTDVFQGKLNAGERLVVTALADRFGVSQSPIREALVTLEGIGIVDIAANRGAVVRRVTETEIREICQVRRILECQAVRLACGRIDLTELHALAEAFRKAAASPVRPRRPRPATMRKQIATARELDSRLHDLIAASCGNDFLTRELSRLKLLFRSFRDVAWSTRSTSSDLARFRHEAKEHLAIVEALSDGDAKAASRAMSRHIRMGVKYWSRGLPRRES